MYKLKLIPLELIIYNFQTLSFKFKVIGAIKNLKDLKKKYKLFRLNIFEATGIFFTLFFNK